MGETIDVRRLVILRKVTRALAQTLRTQLEEYLATMLPLIRPKSVLGDFVSGRTKEAPPFADKAFAELQTQYRTLAEQKPYQLPTELRPPLEINISPLELTPVELSYTADTGAEKKAVTLTMPLKWALTFPECGPHRLKELLAQRNPPPEQVQSLVLHYLVLDLMLRRQPGFAKLLGALRYPLSTGTLPELGALPVMFISAPISTVRPPDAVIVENTEISGMDAFEEVVNLDDILALKDTLRDHLIEQVRSFGPDLLPG